MNRRKSIVGIAIVVGISGCFAMANTLAGVAYKGGSDPLSVSTARFFLPALALAVILIASGRPLVLPGRDGLVAIILGLVTTAYTWCLLTAVSLLPVSLAVLVFYLFPVFTAFIVAAMGWERLKRITVIAAIIAFAGLTLALGIGGKGLDPYGILFAALAAVGLATVSAVSHRVIRDGDSRQVTFYIALTAAVAFTIITWTAGAFVLPVTSEGWWGFVGTNVFYAIAMIGFFVAISMIGPARTTLFSYVEPIVATVAAFILLDQVLEPLQVAGLAIVIGALVVAGTAGLREERARTEPADR